MDLNFKDWAEIDLPTLIVIIVLWLIDRYKARKAEQKPEQR